MCCGTLLLPLAGVILNGYVRSVDVVDAHVAAQLSPKFNVILSCVHFLFGVIVNVQPLRLRVRAATCCGIIVLQALNFSLVFSRTRLSLSVTARFVFQSALLAGALAVPIMRRIAGPLFICAELADQLEGIGQHQEEVAREATQWPARHGKLRLLHRELLGRWTEMYGQVRLRFGGRHGTIELPNEDGSVQIMEANAGEGADDETATDLTTACIVCWAEPCTHAFWPCGHLCVCCTCASNWREGRQFGHGGCIVCRKAAVNCSQVYCA